MSLIRLLIIDDNMADRVLYKRYLERESPKTYDFIECETGRKGIAACIGEKPDCVLLDYFLGDMEGTTVLDTVMKDGFTSPVLMLTGQSNPDIARSLMEKGARAYFTKDELTPSMLHEAIQKVI